MTITPARLAAIHAVLELKRRQHLELRRPLTLAGLRRVLKREAVELLIRPHPRLGELVPVLGRWAIIVDSRQSKTAYIVCAAHELAHLWLHHDPLHERHETTIYDGSPPWYDAVREAEANALTELLIRGPVPDSPSRDRGKKRYRAAAQPAPELPDPDGDAFVAMVRSVPPETRPAETRVVQFAIRRELWNGLSLDAVRQSAGHQPAVEYDNRFTGGDHELVTCSETAAVAIVALLARDARPGAKRAAALIRRTVRQTKQLREATTLGARSHHRSAEHAK